MAGPLYQEAHRRFTYDPTTGELRWKNCPLKQLNGMIAGNFKDGYREARFCGRSQRVHRIIWLMQTGQFPPPDRMIDHANGDRADNRWANLRLATRSQNNHNRHQVRSDSKSGIRGVKYRAERDRYVPILKVGGRERKFGSFRTAEEAKARFREVELQYRGENAECLF